MGAHRKCSVRAQKANWKPEREALGENKPATPSSRTLNLQTCEKINFLFFKLPMYWEHIHLLTAVVLRSGMLRNKNLNVWKWLWNWVIGRGYKNEMNVRKSLDCLEETIGRNMNVLSDSHQVSDRNQDHIIGNWRRHYPCFKAAENSAALYPIVLWKAELVNEDIRCYDEENSKQRIQGVAGFSLLLTIKSERREIKWRRNC